MVLGFGIVLYVRMLDLQIVCLLTSNSAIINGSSLVGELAHPKDRPTRKNCLKVRYFQLLTTSSDLDVQRIILHRRNRLRGHHPQDCGDCGRLVMETS